MVKAAWLCAAGVGLSIGSVKNRRYFWGLTVAVSVVLGVLPALPLLPFDASARLPDPDIADTFSEYSLALGASSPISDYTLAWGCALLCVIWALLWGFWCRGEAKKIIALWAVLLGGVALVVVWGHTHAFGQRWNLIVGGIGALLLILSPTNHLCRAVLQRQLKVQADTTSTAADTNGRDVGVLRGGRIIGPLERGLLLTLGLIGAPAIAAAVIAAKGIVRFPEISRDSKDGNKAEEFLIGSFVSWGVTLVLVIALRSLL